MTPDEVRESRVPSGDAERSRETERKRLEHAAIVDSSDDGIIGMTSDRVITSWNSAAERIYGYTSEDAVGRSVDFLVPPERASELTKMFERLRRGESIRHFQTERLRKDGTRVDVSLTVSPMTDAGGQLTGTSTIARDISELKEAEAQLRRSEARYRDLFENATDLIATVDLESRFTDVNTAFAEALGYSREELIGHSLAEFVPEESHDPVQRAHRGKLDHEVEGTVYEHELIAKDGHRIPVEVASRLIVEDGRPVGTEATCRDVSERKRLQAQLDQAQKMEAIGKLAGGIAHDFNNLLTVINGNADRALGLDDITEIKDSLGEVLKAGTTAGALTRQLLAFSRKQVLRPRVLDVTQVLANVQEVLDRLLGENVPLEMTVAPELGSVRADQTQIEQVLLNLAVNARDAMPNGGLLSVTATNAVVDTDYAAMRVDLEPGDYVALTITDRGLGMDEETQSRIFDPFFTTKSEGTGLGLATVYGIVKQSGGDISVDSEPGVGTTFRVLFPRVDAQPEKPDALQAPAEVLTGTETILVVEDNDPVRRLMANILRSLGYTVETAGCSSEAIDLATNRQGPLELIVSDVMLPGESGPELVAKLQLLHPGTRSLYTSGYAPSLATQRGGLASDEPFLAKPFTSAELASLVRQVLDDKFATTAVNRAA
jgi:two-component system, cell cycle sensor histidine kinase and response regulator CckA